MGRAGQVSPTGPGGYTTPEPRREDRNAYFGAEGLIATPVIGRGGLTIAPQQGPLIVEEYDATTVVPPSCAASLDHAGNIVIEVDAN